MSTQPEFDFNAQPASEQAPADIAEKIKKLLRLGKSSNRHEAELALERAFRLAQKYRIDVESLDLDEESEKLAHEWFRFEKRAGYLHYRAMNVVEGFFRVKVGWSISRIVFIGRPTDVMIARYAFDFIVRTGKRELRGFEISERNARRKMSTGKRENFIEGFIYGIIQQLKTVSEEIVLDDAKTAIVVAEEAARERYFHERLGGSKEERSLPTPRLNRTALMHGYDRGRETRINQPLNNGASAAPLMLT